MLWLTNPPPGGYNTPIDKGVVGGALTGVAQHSQHTGSNAVWLWHTPGGALAEARETGKRGRAKPPFGFVGEEEQGNGARDAR